MKLLTTWEILFTPRRFRLGRVWSNRMLLQIAGMFEGNVVNVSAWEDKDKEGREYRSYFTGATNYTLTNYGGESGINKKEYYDLNLEGEVPDELRGRFDVVFNHTTLEHILDVFKAVENLCLLSRDVVIVVVPFIQEVHTASAYSDYWRFTPHCLRRLFERYRFQVVLMASSPYRHGAIYHLCVASKTPEKWQEKFRHIPSQVNEGKSLFRDPFLANLAFRIWNRLRLTLMR